MKTNRMVMVALAPLLLPALAGDVEASEKRKNVLIPVQVQTSPQVQTAPPAERPYVRRAPPRTAGRTELYVRPAYGGNAFVYNDRGEFIATFEGSGAIMVPEGPAYTVVITRGHSVIWRGQVLATRGSVALSWDQFGTPIVERAPRPQTRVPYPTEFEAPR